jgi:uncharacterized protein YndB with AHSA1/START domain
MSVKVEASGRRSVQVETEVPGTPEQVWQAIATGPGISSWFVPVEIEQQDGKPVAVKMNFGPGFEARSAITKWDAPRMWSSQSDGWVPGSPPIANEWIVEARAGGTCIVRIVHSLFASTDDWDSQIEGAGSGWKAFFANLKIYLTHFSGQRSHIMQVSASAPGTPEDAWDAIMSALGLKGLSVGQHCSSPAGAPSFSGTAEYVTHHPYDALLRIDKPVPGVAAIGTYNMGGDSTVALNFYLYGDHAAETVARETPLWQEWIQQRFPTPAEAQ